ncbi:ATP-binding protein, partial [Candidatus Saccharibacteria bacterium]|nr:ATP-binding protein [Candidatus Saccharibacteria bacterium]
MNQQTYGKLKALRLSGMADADREIMTDQRLHGLSAEETVTLMVDREESRRHHNTRQRLLKRANFEQPMAHISEIDYSDGRMLDRAAVLSMASCHFILDSRNIVIMGATGSGKSYLACAVGIEACKQLYSVRFTRMHSLLEELTLATELKRHRLDRDLRRCNLLIIDDWMLSEIDEKETALLYNLLHDRELGTGTSTMLCTQYDLRGCAMKMTNKTMSDAIYDRLEHN